MMAQEGDVNDDFSFYSDKEVWTPPNNSYPTWDDVCRFIWSRTTRTAQTCTKKMNIQDAVNDLAKFIHDVWVAGDGCPFSTTHIKTCLP